MTDPTEYVLVPAAVLLRLAALALRADDSAGADDVDAAACILAIDLVRREAPDTWATHLFAEQLARLPTTQGANP